MLFALTAVWFVQKSWNLKAKSINSIYENTYQFYILADDAVVLEDTFYKILPDTIEPIRTLVDGDTIVFLTGNIDYPLVLYLRTDSIFLLVDRRGAYSDYDPVSNLSIPISPISGGRPFYLKGWSLRGELGPEIYGRRVFTFNDSLFYIDKLGNLRTSSGRVVGVGVRDVLPLEDKMLLIEGGGVRILNEQLRPIDSVLGNFTLASAFSYKGRDGFLLVSGRAVYMLMDFLEPMFHVPDSILCISPVDYDLDNSLEILVSTEDNLYLYDEDALRGGKDEQMRLMDYQGYGYPSTCGGMYGAKLYKVRQSERYVSVSYIPGGWRISIDIPYSGPVRIFVVDSKGMVVFEEERNIFPGPMKLDIRDHFKPGTYSIIIEGRGFVIKRAAIWKGK